MAEFGPYILMLVGGLVEVWVKKPSRALGSEVMLILSSDGVTGSVTDMEAVGGAEEVLG